jgi:hypothetical protein
LATERSASAVEERGGVFDEETAWDVLAEIPRGLRCRVDPAGAPLGDPATRRGRAGGLRLASEFISPLDLVAVGLVGAAEAEALAASEGDAL